MSHHEEEHHHEPTYGTPILVFLALIALTCITVATAGLKMPVSASIILAMFIASIKASLVLAFFMHLKYEKPIFTIFLGVALSTLAIIMVLTFADYSFRW